MIQMNCRRLTLGYDSALVRDLNFTVSAGDSLYILGENGAGKSTLMKTILGLLPPLEGRVLLSGGVRADEIGYLPQQTRAQRDFPATVWEVALSGCQSRCGLRPFYTRQERNWPGRASGAWIWSDLPALLSGAVGRPAAACAAGTRPVRRPEDAAAGRAGGQ